MAEFSKDLVAIMEAAGIGTFGTTIFESSKAVIPTGDGPYLSIIEYGGALPEVLHQSRTTPGYEFPSAQVFARGKSGTNARTMARAAYAALVKNPATKRPWVNVVVNGTYYVRITVSQQPFDMGSDDAGRIKFGFNVSARKRPPA